MKKETKTIIFAGLVTLILAGSELALVKAINKKDNIPSIPYVRMTKIIEFKDEFLNYKQKEREIINQSPCRDEKHNYKIINPVNNEEYCEADLICYGCGTTAHINYTENCNHYFKLTETNQNESKYECNNCNSYIKMNIKSKNINNKLNYICQECGNIKQINEEQLIFIPHILDYKIMPCEQCNHDTKFLNESKNNEKEKQLTRNK